MSTAPRPPRTGDVFWVGPEVLSPPGSAHVHPQVVVQSNVFNESRIPTVVVCGLTTNLRRASAPGNVLLDEAEANLPRRSVVVVSQVSTVLKSDLGVYLGSVSAGRVEQILDGLALLHRSFPDRSA